MWLVLTFLYRWLSIMSIEYRTTRGSYHKSGYICSKVERYQGENTHNEYNTNLIKQKINYTGFEIFIQVIRM
jgi:hypothetical protein